jgi:signal transduction histidine kinase
VHAEHDRVLSIVRDVSDSKRALALSRDLAGRLLVSQEAERARIARDLHDDACQKVAGIAIEISHLLMQQDIEGTAVHRALSAVYSRVGNVAETLRLLSHDLHPSVLQHIGLIPALKAHCAEVERQYDMQVRLIAERGAPVPEDVALALYRIAQEALRNAATHGNARHVSVELTHTDDRLTLSIDDDGEGFDVVRARHQRGLGLVSIEERARLVKGHVAIRSQPQQGTRVEVRVPIVVAAIQTAGRPV